MNRKDFFKKGFLSILGVSILGKSIAESAGKTSLFTENFAKQAKENFVGFNHLPHSQHNNIMENVVFHPANTRGHANHGWLNSYHTFSFASYHDPERVHFGALRVLNDDTVQGGMGFSKHGYDNMEIISIPLSGDLRHKDSMGNETIIKQGDVQIMSAGTGIQHSEMNHNQNEQVKFLQIWVFPKYKDITPNYDQKTFDVADRKNKFQLIVSPDKAEGSILINQDAWFSLGNFEKGQKITYSLKNSQSSGVYAFILKGEATINGHKVNDRDGLGISKIEKLAIETQSDTEILLMEVPF
jgi:redox-sensitive bicupin YhaK (pirin superfamily)